MGLCASEENVGGSNEVKPHRTTASSQPRRKKKAEKKAPPSAAEIEEKRRKRLAAAEKRMKNNPTGGVGKKKSKKPNTYKMRSVEQMKRIDAAKEKTTRKNRNPGSIESENPEAFGAAIFDTKPKM
mmetsp:Transcript_2111/g.3038  ORF Transcript_2111/g.3038 Transcript_2111/m.3038 type:complete len:126 (-) Transcript_2111:95-472(-)|eukprot:CAMPEP_0167756710 /NCGR_PEP_ID=MMETSP0110_2-20121227/9534_1 /TAXON_ID=629695 /ORGANISM="Gymnochlora sp., Strain CCMP2014" /LENGTH=125 /DNA_ID=CAMNT_0007642845 /DNA_START=77 /DNA_END=454 /DNA_ORIENTATION=+